MSGFDWATLGVNCGIAAGTIGAVVVSLVLAHRASVSSERARKVEREHMARQVNVAPEDRVIRVYNGSDEPITHVQVQIHADVEDRRLLWFREAESGRRSFLAAHDSFDMGFVFEKVGPDVGSFDGDDPFPLVRARMRWVDSTGDIWEREYGFGPKRIGNLNQLLRPWQGFFWLNEWSSPSPFVVDEPDAGERASAGRRHAQCLVDSGPAGVDDGHAVTELRLGEQPADPWPVGDDQPVGEPVPLMPWPRGSAAVPIPDLMLGRFA